MESSEDDAGAATSAPRRPAAREKDIGAEKSNATGSSSLETSEARTSCQTPAMSEENFDGDSVPSPSSHDANTSTEAILDMIDEIVDGPGAPKRLPHSLDAVGDSASNSDKPELPTVESEDNTSQLSVQSPAVSAKSDQEPDASESEPPESASICDTGTAANVVGTAEIGSPQSSVPVSEIESAAESTITEESVIESAKTEPFSNCPLSNIPTSSVAETEQSISNVSACQTQDRTVKCVTSSDSCDNVTVESAESTSSDSSVSDGKVQVQEASTRSPLRRRLVRPAPSDRRPDSTVSSTSTSDEHVAEQSVEIKDVSSSSDALPTVHGNVNEETRNVSEISVCKAETSMSPPKKIKLIRQKTTPASHKDHVQDKPMILPEQERCQSTSVETAETLSEPCPQVTASTSSTCTDEDNVKSNHNEEVMNEISIQIPRSECRKEDKEKIDEDSSAGQGALMLASKSKDEIGESTVGKTISTDCDQLGPSLPTKSKEDHCTVTEQVIASDTDKQYNVPEEQTVKQVPKLTIKLSSKQSEEMKSPVPKLTIKPIKLPVPEVESENSEEIPSISKLNIKPIPKPSQVNDISTRSSSKNDNKTDSEKQIPLVTKINIKPIPKPPEKINDVHRKSSSSEISESEYSENDDTSTSDQASASDQGPTDIVPKVTIKLGKPGTQSEGKFYTEKNIPKLTIKGLQNEKEDERIIPKLTIKNINMHHDKEDSEKSIPKLTIKGIQHGEKEDLDSKLKLIVSQADDKQSEKIPKLTIKTVPKSENQPLSPKLTIKPIKPPLESVSKESMSDIQPIPKLKISTDSVTSIAEVKENAHVPKITIKPVTRTDIDSKTSKKSTLVCDSPEHIPVVTKLNIKPILKPTESGETSENLEEKVPVVSKLNIKPLVKPKDNEVDSCVEDIPKITKLNIKPIKCPEGTSSEEKDCDELNADIEESSIPVVTKLNIKPILKPVDEDTTKDSENQSSETGNSSDDNADHIPVVTKLNIKPILKPNDLEDVSKQKSNDQAAIPVVTKLNIKPLVKPDENVSPLSPKRDNLKSSDSRNSNTTIPVVTKLNIKPVVKPEDESDQKSVKNPPLVMKINMKAVADTSSNESICVDKKVNHIDDSREHIFNNFSEEASKVSKPNLKIILKSSDNDELERISSENLKLDRVSHKEEEIKLVKQTADLIESNLDISFKPNCVPETAEKVNSDEFDTHDELPSCSMASDSESKSVTATNISKETVLCPVPNSTLSQLLENSNQQAAENKEKSETDIKLDNLGTTDSPLVDSDSVSDVTASRNLTKQQNTSVQNCTLLKKLLQTTDDGLDKRLVELEEENNRSSSPSLLCQESVNCIQGESRQGSTDQFNSETIHDNTQRRSQSSENASDDMAIPVDIEIKPIQEIYKEASENLKKPLEINISDKVNQGSGQDSPRIILKINKTDHGASAKIITEESCRPEAEQQNSENTQEIVNDKQSPKRNLLNSRRKLDSSTTQSAPVGKRLRSSRIVESADKTPIVRRNAGKRPPPTESSPPLSKEPELSVLETKRLKLGQLLSNKSLTITPVKVNQEPPTNKSVDNKQDNKGKTVNHNLLNNENCSKNGNSKLHNILSNLQVNQLQVKPVNDINCTEKNETATLEVDSNISSGSGECEIVRVENCHPEVQEMMINENFEFPNFGISSDDVSQDPLEVDSSKSGLQVNNEVVDIPKPVEMTPQPKKRGRPRKFPLSEGAKPVPPPVVALPVPALEERPQRSLRLSRDRPVIVAKPRGGRGRGRGARRVDMTPPAPPPPVTAGPTPEAGPEPEVIDPTSSRIKLPRMTEALDKMPSTVCTTPLSSRRGSDSTDLKLFGDTQVVLENALPKMEDPFVKSPESSSQGRGGRGSRGRGGRAGRSPARGARRGGRGRGGGRGAMYMKETLGIYGRVCGPATTTVQLFEEETCMMDDNATPAKPSCLLDEDSQSSVKSSTNESSKMKKSKFADLFDSNKVWTAADVKEYTWPPPGEGDEEPQVMMIQEQVAMFLGVKGFKRRYPALRRRAVAGGERALLLRRGLVTPALADTGITAVDASEVLDIMLSDYPHKYEEYRSHQRERQVVEEEVKEERVDKVEMKIESKPVETKPEPPKIDPEKTRQDMALAAMAAASEWNSRLNALRRPACVDLQSLTIQRRLPRPAPRPAPHVRPPCGFYPHALLPGQYQHTYRVYTPDQLRYFPLNTALAAPPAAADSSSESEAEWPERRDSSDSDAAHHLHKRKRVSKVKRSSHMDPSSSKEKDVKEESRDGGEAELCRACGLRLEANRRYTHERFLVCADCNAKLHPGCVELGADTIRKCREYAWQCAECKSCNACRRPHHGSRMLFCDLCDRGFHSYCVGLDKVPTGRWHCVECAVCKSCGARSPDGAGGSSGVSGVGGVSGVSGAPPTWHHQTRRGPGGHKLYSHSLCTPCARAYRIGRYCPLCERSFIGPKGNLQLVICKLCDRQHHQECVRPTVSALNVLDYTCGECRRGGITSRAAAVRLAPRTIATLFMAKRRFNKYAHRQYLQSRLAAKSAEAEPEAEPEAEDDSSRDTDAARPSADYER